MYENYGWKWWLTAGLAALAVLGLKMQPLNLGLDLRGGAQLIYRLEVEGRGWIGADVRAPRDTDSDSAGLYVTTIEPKSPADEAGFQPGDIIKEVDGVRQVSETTFRQLVMREKGKTLEIKYKRGATVATTKLTVKIQEQSQAKLTDNVIEVLKRRLDGFGLREMTIQKQGRFGIIIQVPGVGKSELKDIKDIVRRGGKLDFKIVVNDRFPEIAESQRKQEIERIRNEKANGTYDLDDKYDVGEYRDSKTKQVTGYRLLKNPGVSGNYLANAYRTTDRNSAPAIGFTWNSLGASQFYKLTSENTQKDMAIVLDGEIQSAPTIRSAISSQGIIEGKFSEDEILRVVVVLKGGALAAKPILQSEQVVGPSLGRVSLTLGSYAIICATLIVLCFMVSYYKGSGIIANVALILNIVLMLGILTTFEATLTLPGIAGILLTAGMAVDSNILIFERIREELEKGTKLKQAIQTGYDRAFWTIFDANITTLITAFVLFKAGTGPIKGFAVTLMTGIICSMFTALFVTKAIYGYMVSKELFTEMKLASVLSNPSYDFMSQSKKWAKISLITINIGFFIFVARGAEKYGLDFTGGSMVRMSLAKPLSTREVEQRLSKLGRVKVTQMGESNAAGKGYFFQVATRKVAEELESKTAVPAVEGAPKHSSQDLFRNKVRELFHPELIETTLGINGKAFSVANAGAGKAKLTFKIVARKPDSLANKAIPTTALLKQALKSIEKLDAAQGLAVTQVMAPESDKGPYLTFSITTGAISSMDSAKKEAFERINKALESSRDFDVAQDFSEVFTVGGSVAYNLKSKAFIALFFSLIAIVLYITLRFKFRFGVAAIAALVHDVLFAIGFLALVDGICSALNIPFDAKINLPTIAAFLTIIGYSLNDTIVVFDRIRELEGSRKMKGTDYTDLVNIAINSTLSRTILTSLTTFFVVFVLFIASLFGLWSIQGLSLALLVGVVVGTYSSIFVASSVLAADQKKIDRLFLMQMAALVVIFGVGRIVSTALA